MSTPSKRNKIIYWIATVWLCFGMVFTGVYQLMKMPAEVDKIVGDLGFPVYILTILGIGKILGSIAVLAPKFPILKEWAYAGFVFAMAGALFSHIATGSEATEYIGPVLLIVLTAVSSYFRPADRKLTAA